MSPVVKIYDSVHEIFKTGKYCGDKVDQCSTILWLGCNIEEDTNRLVKDGHSMTCRDVAEVIERTPEEAAVILSDLISNNILHASDGAFFFNPEYIEVEYMTKEQWEAEGGLNSEDGEED